MVRFVLCGLAAMLVLWGLEWAASVALSHPLPFASFAVGVAWGYHRNPPPGRRRVGLPPQPAARLPGDRLLAAWTMSHHDTLRALRRFHAQRMKAREPERRRNAIRRWYRMGWLPSGWTSVRERREFLRWRDDPDARCVALSQNLPGAPNRQQSRHPVKGGELQSTFE